MAMLAELVDGVIGVDTHRDTLAAAAVTSLGGVLAQTTTSADAAGYQQLLGFAHRHLPGRRCWAVEGAGSFGAGLTAVLQQRGEWVVEVGQADAGTTADSSDLKATRRGASCTTSHAVVPAPEPDSDPPGPHPPHSQLHKGRAAVSQRSMAIVLYAANRSTLEPWSRPTPC